MLGALGVQSHGRRKSWRTIFTDAQAHDTATIHSRTPRSLGTKETRENWGEKFEQHDEEPNCATVEGRLTIRKGRPEGTNRGVSSTLGPARRRFRPIVFTLPTETFYYLQLTFKPTIF